MWQRKQRWNDDNGGKKTHKPLSILLLYFFQIQNKTCNFIATESIKKNFFINDKRQNFMFNALVQHLIATLRICHMGYFHFFVVICRLMLFLFMLVCLLVYSEFFFAIKTYFYFQCFVLLSFLLAKNNFLVQSPGDFAIL